MGQRSIRFSDELEARIEAVAKRDDRSFSYVVTRTMERALEKALEPASDMGVTAPGRGGNRPPAPPRAPDEPVAEVLGSKVRKTPSLKETWGR